MKLCWLDKKTILPLSGVLIYCIYRVEKENKPDAFLLYAGSDIVFQTTAFCAAYNYFIKEFS